MNKLDNYILFQDLAAKFLLQLNHPGMVVNLKVSTYCNDLYLSIRMRICQYYAKFCCCAIIIC